MFDPAKTFDDNFDNGPYPDIIETYQNAGEPQYSFLGHKIFSPFGVGAGSLPTSKHVSFAFNRGFDVVCYKTQRSVPFKVNDFPNVTYLDVEGDLTLEKLEQPLVGHLESDKPVEELTITNSFGNPSRGPEFWVDDMKQAVAAQGAGQLLIASAVGTIQEGFTQEDYFEDFATAAKFAVEAGAPVIEINLSCPNVANEGILCYSPDLVKDILSRVRKAIGNTALVAKIGYFSPQQQGIFEQMLAENEGVVNAWSAINTLVATVVDEKGEQLLPGPGRLKSGACGAGIKWAGLEMVKRLDEQRQKHGYNYEIIGIGGVMTPADFHDYRKAGADVVQCVTAAMWNADLASQVKASL
jgi:dihydroorotate dehydrogenase